MFPKARSRSVSTSIRVQRIRLAEDACLWTSAWNPDRPAVPARRGNDALRGSASSWRPAYPDAGTGRQRRSVGSGQRDMVRILLSFEAGAPCIAPRATRSRSIPSCLQSLALIRSEFRGNRLAIALEATQAHREKLHPAAHRPVRAEVGFGGCRRFPPCFRSLVELLEEAVEVQALDEGSLAAMVEAAWLVGRRTDHAPGTLEARHGACGSPDRVNTPPELRAAIHTTPVWSRIWGRGMAACPPAAQPAVQAGLPVAHAGRPQRFSRRARVGSSLQTRSLGRLA